MLKKLLPKRTAKLEVPTSCAQAANGTFASARLSRSRARTAELEGA